MVEIHQEGAVHQQDESLLRKVLGLGAKDLIPEPVLGAYYEIRRQKHRIIGGPLAVDTILLVVHASKGMELVPEPKAQEQKPPGRALETSEGKIQPDVPMIGGTEMYVRLDGEWCTAEYMGPGKQGNFRFKLGNETVQVPRSNVRLKD